MPEPGVAGHVTTVLMSAQRPVLAILTHWTDAFEQRRYLIKLMMENWQAKGWTIIVRHDRQAFVPADVAFVHTDLSVIPQSVSALAARYPRVINGAAAQ